MGWSPGGDFAADTSIYQRFNQIVVQKRSKNHGLLKMLGKGDVQGAGMGIESFRYA